ncbi:MAG TPA: efflux RND transporter permease subunit [Bryobacteraceae bacterium]|nr:efflux RND transporter permease subunit [Bryobacteraceae bacterium]
MSSFSIRNPYLIVVLCLIVAVVGITTLARMPVDLFPAIQIPVVVVATFYNGMPPEQIEADITGRFERFFTLASGIEHIESRSLPGVSLIKVFFQPGTDPDAAVSNISTLAMANLRRLPPGTLPPVVLKFDASSLPVCLITLKGQGLHETKLRDTAQYAVRNQVANVRGASVPQPFGGKYRQIMVYVDPLKLDAHALSPMDVVRAVNDSNLILPAGEIRLGPLNYSIYTNSQIDAIPDINGVPLKTVDNAFVTVGDIGHAKDAQAIQLNIVRVDGQKSAYLPVLKQGGDTNTIAVVDGIREAVAGLTDVPESLRAEVVFDQSQFVKKAIRNLMHEGGLGLFLTSLMILLFLGSFRATSAVLLSIPLSALATFIVLSFRSESINSMVLGGLALAFSRLIDNSVVVLENIYRHLEMGKSPREAAEVGGREVMLPVLAATITTAIVFFPVTFLYGVSKFLFTSLAAAVVIALAASYLVAMTVVPLFCAFLLKAHDVEQHGPSSHEAAGQPANKSTFAKLIAAFNRQFERLLGTYSGMLRRSLARPGFTVALGIGIFAVSLLLYPLLGVAFFPRTDAGQFVANLKAPVGTRLELTEEIVQRFEDLIRRVVPKEELNLIVSNIGVQPGFSSIYTSNSAQHTATVQVSLKEGHRVGSYDYMDQVRQAVAHEMPEVTAFFQSGGLVDAVLNLGLPAPIDVQVSGSNLERNYQIASSLATRIRQIPGVKDVYVPQDLDYPALRLDVNRVQAGKLGLNQREIVQNVITAVASNQMIAPSYWVDPRSGNDYLMTVQYPEGTVRNLLDLRSIPLRAPREKLATHLDAVSSVRRSTAPTEVSHYQLRRTIDLYVSLAGEDLGRVAKEIDAIIAKTQIPRGVRVDLRGMVQGMRSSFQSFGLGLLLALLLLYLVLVAQFRSFTDPVIILLAVPTGLAGVLATLYLAGTTLNVMSLMGIVMMVGIVVSNSILLVDFTRNLQREGMPVAEALEFAGRARLRPILMTSLATVIGLMPMALGLGEGSESYAPLAQAIIGGLSASLVFTVFVVPAAYQIVYRRREAV